MPLSSDLARSLYVPEIVKDHAVQSAFRDYRVTDEPNRHLREQRVVTAVLRAFRDAENARNLPPVDLDPYGLSEAADWPVSPPRPPEAVCEHGATDPDNPHDPCMMCVMPGPDGAE